MGKTVLVCGDRNWTDRETILAELEKLQTEGYTHVIEGGARGADKLAGSVAVELSMDLTVVEADWYHLGTRAGPIRNSEMLKMKPDLVLAFHPDLSKSKGTADTVRKARKMNLPVRILE